MILVTRLFSSVRRKLLAFATGAIVSVVAVAAGSAWLLKWTKEGDAANAAAVANSLRSSHAALEKLVGAQISLQSIIRLKDADEIEAAMAHYEKARTDAASHIARSSPEAQAKFKELIELGQATLQEVLTGNNASAIEVAVTRYNPLFGECILALRRHTEEIERRAAADAAAHRLLTLRVLQLAGAVLAVLVLVIGVSAWRFQRSVSHSLSETAQRLSEAADALSGYSSEVTRSTQIVADGAGSQAASLQETSASLEEMSSMTRRNAESAMRAKTTASSMRGAAESGFTDMQALNHAMQAIQDSSGNIGKIVKTIDEIAFQTNILALNAAVEAARAGQAGAGFAVVADEVRSLAQRSADAAKESAEKIAESIARGNHGADLTAKVSSGLKEIVGNIRAVDDLIGEISVASNEQSSGLSQIVSAVGQIDNVTQTNAATAQECAGAVTSMHNEVDVLRQSVAALRTLLGEKSAAPKRDAQPLGISGSTSCLSCAIDSSQPK